MDTFVHVIGGGMVTLLLAAAMPEIIHQATSDEGGFHSGAHPDWELDYESYENSLPPTMEDRDGEEVCCE